MNYLGSLLLLSAWLFSSCLPVETEKLVFKEKSLIGLTTPTGQDEFSLAKEEATYANVTKFIFKDKCLRCHNQERARAGVDLSQYSTLFDWSDYFTVIVEKGDPDASGVYTEVARGGMPPRNPLSDEEVEFIKRWIEEGAVK